MPNTSTDFFNTALPCGFYNAEMDLSRIIYVRCLAPFENGKFNFPLYEICLRTKGSLEKYMASQQVIMMWAKAEGEGLVDHVEKLFQNFENTCSTFAGIKLKNRPLIMGIVNVTPDSFSDGGDNFQTENAIAHGKSMWAAGADILDVGGESTRPGAKAVLLEEELRRVIPVIEGLKKIGATLSIDTRHADVMRAAVQAGADIINDVTALEGAGALQAASELDVPVMLMHMQGEPQTMQENPVYDDCVLDVYDYLYERIKACESVGIKRSNICIDPGIGFGKSLLHNMEILDRLAIYQGLGTAVLLGASRKSFIAKICDDVAAKDRLAGSLSAGLQGANTGVQIVRVHDVAETKQAFDVWAAFKN